MAVTWFTSQGAPSDSVGVQGDMVFDSQNRFIWGPKGTSSWDGTANNVNPIFSAVALLGRSMFAAPYNYTNSVQLSGTPQAMTMPGTTVAATFTPVSPSAFMGAYAYSNVAATLALYDVAANTVVYSASLAANKNFMVGPFSTNTYQLTAGRTYQWMVSGSAGSAVISMQPYYLSPATSPGLCVGQGPLCGYSATTTFTSTAVNVPLFGTAQGANIGIYAPIRTGGLYAVQGTYTPASGTAATASVQAVLNVGNVATGNVSGGTGQTIRPLTATGLPQVLYGPVISDVTSLAAGSFYYFSVTGSGAGTLSLSLLPLL